MRETFNKGQKWFVISVFMVAGFAALFKSDAMNSIKPMMAAVLSFGMAYLLGYFWHKFRKEVMLCSILIFISTGVSALYGPGVVYVWTGVIIDFNFYYLWIALNAVVGVPLIMWALEHFD